MTTVGISASTSSTLLWNAGAVAGIAGAIARRELKPASFDSPDEELRQALLSAAALSANDAAKDLSQDWQRIS